MLVDGTSTTAQKVVPITIERGCLPGTQILFEGEGDKYSDGTSSDLIVVIRDLPHPHFRRESIDLVYKATISSLTGATIYIRHLDGRQLEIPVNAINTYENEVFLKK
jgi:DnaJ-class molecular chaperone